MDSLRKAVSKGRTRAQRLEGPSELKKILLFCVFRLTRKVEREVTQKAKEKGQMWR